MVDFTGFVVLVCKFYFFVIINRSVVLQALCIGSVVVLPTKNVTITLLNFVLVQTTLMMTVFRKTPRQANVLEIVAVRLSACVLMWFHVVANAQLCVRVRGLALEMKLLACRSILYYRRIGFSEQHSPLALICEEMQTNQIILCCIAVRSFIFV